MSDRIQAIQDDLEYMRALAKEGQAAPLLGGSFLASAGLCFGLASIGEWAVVAHVLQAGENASIWIWLAAMAIFFGSFVVLSRRGAAKPGSRTASNRAFRAVWNQVAYVIFFMSVAVGAAAWRMQDPKLIYLFAPLILAVYGGAWGVAAAITGRGWIRLVSLESFAAAVAAGWLSGAPAQYLLYAGALFLLAFLPGVLLMRQEPSEIV